MSKIKIASLIGLLLIAIYAVAGPAPWYKWQSLYDGTVICSQNWPGEGWEQGAGKFGGSSGPFKDARCTQAGTPDH
jgi:hypothetical protein